MLTQRAPAKINLFLHAGTKRPDGFHPLQSLAVFTDLGDVLELATGTGLSMVIGGPFGGGLEGNADNLVMQAARAMNAYNIEFHLTKNLPVASGIGGGSSDAAAALRGLETFLNRAENQSALAAMAARLGSDVPVCLAAVAAFMEGRGEILRPVESMPRVPMLLVNPGVEVSTKDVFAALKDRSGVDMALPRGRFRDTADLLRFLETTRNDLEASARALQPVIGEVLTAIAALPGALFARMSGSGATCFGIFADDDCCHRAAHVLKAAAPDWWIAPTFVPEAGIVHEDIGQDIGPTDAGL